MYSPRGEGVPSAEFDVLLAQADFLICQHFAEAVRQMCTSGRLRQPPLVAEPQAPLLVGKPHEISRERRKISLEPTAVSAALQALPHNPGKGGGSSSRAAPLMFCLRHRNVMCCSCAAAIVLLLLLDFVTAVACCV